jgi:lipid II:glycine glycyltransferase (peptidoglycan interpeptide bridge formation enzyme)
MKIIKLDKKNYEKYENFLLSFDESLLYYSTKYKELLEEYLGVESEYLLAIDENENIQAVLPLMKKEGKFGIIINSLPFYGSNGGVLAKDENAYQVLLDYYDKVSNKVAGSTYITNPLIRKTKDLEYDVLDKRIGQWTFIGYEEEIEENIMKSFESSARRNVRKAIKENVKVEIDNSQIDFLYETHYENITSIGGKAKEKRFFELIEKYFEKEKDYNIYIAKLGEKKIGALLLFYFNQTVEYFTPAVVGEYRNLQALPLIIYKAMIRACQKGYKWWNWGGTWLSQEGVYRFKKKFGAVDKEYRYFIKINNQNIYNSNKEELLKEYDNFYVIPFDKLKG